MFRPLSPDVAVQLHWLPITNASGEVIPAHAAVRVTGGGNSAPYTVAKPDTDGGYVWIASGYSIEDTFTGVATTEGPVWALYDTGDGTPAVGETWGAGASSWKLRKDKAGFRVVGEPDTELEIVPVVRESGGSEGPEFRGVLLRHSAAQSIPASTDTALAFDTEGFDEGDFHSTVTNTTRITIPEDGKYHFGGAIQYAMSSTGSRFAKVRKNGTTVIAQDSKLADTATTTDIDVSGVANFVAGDYIELMARQTSLGALNATAVDPVFPTFWCYKIAGPLGNEDAFGVVAVAGQPNVVADAPHDTLTLVAGSGITLTTDASIDAVTIAATISGVTATPPVTVGRVAKFVGATTISDSSLDDSNADYVRVVGKSLFVDGVLYLDAPINFYLVADQASGLVEFRRLDAVNTGLAYIWCAGMNVGSSAHPTAVGQVRIGGPLTITSGGGINIAIGAGNYTHGGSEGINETRIVGGKTVVISGGIITRWDP